MKKLMAISLIIIAIGATLVLSSCDKNEFAGRWYDSENEEEYIEIHDNGSYTHTHVSYNGNHYYNTSGRWEADGTSITLIRFKDDEEIRTDYELVEDDGYTTLESSEGKFIKY